MNRDAAAPAHPCAGQLRLCFVGDSFVQGIGDPTCMGWTGRVVRSALERAVPLTAMDDHRTWLDEVARGDGAHPGATGYALIAQLVETWPGWWFGPSYRACETALPDFPLEEVSARARPR